MSALQRAGVLPSGKHYCLVVHRANSKRCAMGLGDTANAARVEAWLLFEQRREYQKGPAYTPPKVR